MEKPDLFAYERREGDPIQHEGRQIIPVSKALKIALPFGGFVWNRPAGMRVIAADGTESFLPVIDVTRAGVLGALAMAATLGVALAVIRRLARLMRK